MNTFGYMFNFRNNKNEGKRAMEGYVHFPFAKKKMYIYAEIVSPEKFLRFY